jgi:hypothetical protein
MMGGVSPAPDAIRTGANGYARIAFVPNATNMPITLDPTSPAGYIMTVLQNFSPTGAGFAATRAFLCTSADNSGILIASTPLNSGETSVSFTSTTPVSLAVKLHNLT